MSSVTTRDAIFSGRVSLVQPARGRGYRINGDAILLATFAAEGRRGHAAFDLGAGVGAVGHSLIHLDAAARVTMIEIDERLAALAEENAAANGWSERVEVVTADVVEAARARPGAADLIVCNPPYVPPGRGRAPLAARARARAGSLTAFLDAARFLAGRRARACFVYPALETTTLLLELRHRGLEPKRLRAVHGRTAAPARVVLVECVAGRPGGLVVETPYVEG